MKYVFAAFTDFSARHDNPSECKCILPSNAILSGLSTSRLLICELAGTVFTVRHLLICILLFLDNARFRS